MLKQILIVVAAILATVTAMSAFNIRQQQINQAEINRKIDKEAWDKQQDLLRRIEMSDAIREDEQKARAIQKAFRDDRLKGSQPFNAK
jgi:predicted Holliday junction resolvase-like endonuclease